MDPIQTKFRKCIVFIFINKNFRTFVNDSSFQEWIFYFCLIIQKLFLYSFFSWFHKIFNLVNISFFPNLFISEVDRQKQGDMY